MKADTGASGHYLTQQDQHGCQEVRPTTAPKNVLLPTNEIISSTHDAYLPIYSVSKQATSATIFPALTNSSLLSIGQLCDDNCSAIFTKTNLQIIKDDKIILEGMRNLTDGLWDVPLYNEPQPYLSANAIIQKKKSKEQLAAYYHACCFSPCISTFSKAIKNGNFHSWPGLQDLALYKHMKRTMATSMGHLDQEQQGLQSTKSYKDALLQPSTSKHQPLQTLDNDILNDFFPSSPSPISKSYDCVAQLIPFTQEKKGFMDLTGRFPHASSRGSEYVLVAYDFDSNAIFAEALNSRRGSEIKRGWMKIHKKLKNRGAAPNIYIMDNECSNDLKLAMTEEDLDWQLATPYLHRVNAAERAIRTFKNHFIAGLATCHPDFPISEWDRLLEQAVLTLNLLRNSRVTPRLSAYAYLNGPYDFNKCPMAPPGTLIAVHIKPNKRASWAAHSKRAWYIGPSLQHYRNFKCYLPSTKSEIVSDTVDLFAYNMPVPDISNDEYIQQALMDILAVLQNKSKINVPSLQYGQRINDAVIAISTLLGKASPKPILQAPHKPASVDPPEERVSNVSKIPTVQHLPNHNAQVPRVPIFNSTKLSSFKHLAVHHLQAQQFFQFKINHIYNKDGKKETLDSLILKNPAIWGKALSNEWGRLAQGNMHGIIGTNTIEFITRDQIPAGRDVTYASFVCDERPLKPEPFRVRVVVGGDKLSFNDDAGSPATDLLETKLLLNSTISDSPRGAFFISADIKDYFLGSNMKKPEFMKVHIRKFSPDIIQQYKLREKMDANNYVYIRIIKGMYGLKQAAILAYTQLVQALDGHGYYPEPQTTGIWSHKTLKTKFCLCVDDFGIKVFSKEDAKHLLNALKSKYQISVDWEGTNYCGLTLDWDYNNGHVDISMPGYVMKQLHRYQHPKPIRPQFAPHQWSVPSYGKQPQLVHIDKTKPLDKQQTKLVQSISGAFLYYGRAVDPTILPALTDIASAQSQPTEHTIKACHMLMNFLHTFPNAKIRFSKSQMILYVDSDAAYLVLPQARSCIAGHFALKDHPPTSPSLPQPNHPNNGPILTICRRLRNVVSSAAEAETGAAFINSQTAIPILRTLKILGHPQPIEGTPFKMDNSVTTRFIHSNMRQKRSKHWDMRYHWMRDKESLKLFRYYWARGSENNADYFTKHHPPNIHRKMRPQYILKNNILVEKIFHACQPFFPPKERIKQHVRGCVAVPISYSSDSPRACKQLQPRVTWHSAALKAK